MTNIIDWSHSCLPDDCLLTIHQKLQNRDDRDAFGLTCKRWLHIQNIARTQLVFDFSYNPRRQQEYPQYIQQLLIRFPYLSKLSLSGCTDLPDSALKPLVVSCSSLRYLSLYCCVNITDAGLGLISTGCHNLETLNLYRCNITDAGLQSIARSSHILKNVNLSYCLNITDHGLNALCSGCPKLHSLIINSCKGIVGTGLKGSPPTLTYLEAENCMLSSEGVHESVSGPGLEYLNLSHPASLSRHGDGLGNIGLGYARRLRFLNLRMCRHMSDESASAIAKGCPMLEEWNLALCHGIRLPGWLAIGSNCNRLRVLHVNRCKNLCNQGLNALRDGCDRLEVLYIHGSKVTNTGLEIFKMYRFNVVLKREDCVGMSISPCVAKLFL
ncbi:F-box/RNI-like superfamily protein [Rhynchospora pubera]|uniref:F-box/RNI-like superfamily protein n=1 Tax=Rhynchospora pubera TaxID=906938 RepID=A0AAV8FUM7_9POAL|nr:F-box/RNI-like superfamily protein [Rhynchospora pubera]